MGRPGLIKRHLIPRGLFGRALLIVILPLLILQGVLAFIFYDRHWETVTRWLALGLANEVSYLVAEIQRADGEEEINQALNRARRHFDFGMSFEPGGELIPATRQANFLEPGLLDDALNQIFSERLSQPFAVDTRLSAQPSRIAIYVQLDKGLLRILASRKRVETSTTTLLVLWMLGLSALLIVLAVYFLRRQVRPIRRLAMAADSFGKGRDIGTFKLEGASEIRQAGAAFNQMRKRILRFVTQRTEMLAAVSHDLRTPLTRMKLELALMDPNDPAVRSLSSDIEDMQRMLDSYLAFVRGEGREVPEACDLSALVEDLVEQRARNGADVQVGALDPCVLSLRPVAIRRCIANLLDNAQAYGARVRAAVINSGERARVIIDDDGPGIPPDQREHVFTAFTRLEQSRNIHTGGVGLGLTIARDIAVGHGGDVQLSDSPLGGLRAVVLLPH
ncbi:MAG: ATP-binding protein [Geminicoccaceae bacterium]